MSIQTILSPSRTQWGVAGGSKKRTLEHLSELLSDSLNDEQVDADEIFNAFIERERLGSTALEQGVAVPHCRMAACNKAVGAFIHLNEGIDFEARDEKPVDLIFALLVPEQATEEHLQILSEIVARLGRPSLTEKMRQASNDQTLYELITQEAT